MFVRRKLLLAAVLAAICGCRSVERAPDFKLNEEAWSFDGEPGVKQVTDHFEIHTTLKDEVLRDALPRFLETAYRLYVELLPPRQPQGPKLQTFLFNTRDEWDRFTRRTFPARYPIYARIQNGGFAEGRMCVVYYLRRAYTLSVIAHEGMHQYFGAHFSVPVPAWLNEGLACYCESFDFQGDQPVFVPRRNTFRLNPLRRTLTGDAVIPLRELLATNAGEVVSEGRGGLTQAYYAQAWALVVFLRHGADGRYAEGFEKLLGHVRDGSLPGHGQAARLATGSPGSVSPGEGVFRAYFTHDLDGFEQEYRAYMEELAGLR
jgi:hypothetical protein